MFSYKIPSNLFKFISSHVILFYWALCGDCLMNIAEIGFIVLLTILAMGGHPFLAVAIFLLGRDEIFN
jgi:hypothetical protein